MPAGAGTSNLHQQRMPGGVYIASSGGLKGGWKRDKEALKRLRRGWYLGSEAFKKELLERMAGQLGEHHSGELHLESAEAKAERIVGEELQRRGWKDSDLVSRRKSDPENWIAARLRKETTLPLKRIAARVLLGASKSANAKLHLWIKGKEGYSGDAQPQL